MVQQDENQPDKQDKDTQGTPIVLNDGTVFHNADGSILTEEEIEAEAEAFERGELPGGPGEWGPPMDMPEEMRHPDEFISLHRGRPKISPKDDDPAETISFKLPHSQLDKLDRVAKAHGHTRSELLRIAVDRVLEFA